MAALLRAKVTCEDQVDIKKTTGMQHGYMVLSEFENQLGRAVAKVFPSESTAKAYANGQTVIKVSIIREFT